MRDMIVPGMTTGVKKLLREIHAQEVIPPDNGKEYIGNSFTYHVGNGKLVRLTEKQRNLAVIIATEEKLPVGRLMARAGYDYGNVVSWSKDTKVSTIKNYWNQKFIKSNSKSVQAYVNHIQTTAAEELNINAEWLLGQQISLYQIAKANDKLDTAARLLHDISGHIDIDARVRQKIEVETTVDYAALLDNASKRVIDITPDSQLLEEPGVLQEIKSISSPIGDEAET